MKKSLLKLFRARPIKLSRTKLKKIKIAAEEVNKLKKMPDFDKKIEEVYKVFL